MGWIFKPVLNTGATFSGDMVYNSTNMEVPDTVIKYISDVNIEIKSMFQEKYTGFETVKYQVIDSSLKYISISFGQSPKWVYDIMSRLAVAVNGAGMVVQFKDTFVSGTTASPITYYCTWLNSGDFIDIDEGLSGLVMELETFSLPTDIVVVEYQKTIEIPASDLQWDLYISTVGVTYEYQRVP